MSNLATIKTQISEGLFIEPTHITDVIDALTGAKTFVDVEKNKSNFPLMSGNNLLGNPLAGNLAKLLNPNYGLGIEINGVENESITTPSSVDITSDFEITFKVNISDIGSGDTYTPLFYKTDQTFGLRIAVATKILQFIVGGSLFYGRALSSNNLNSVFTISKKYNGVNWDYMLFENNIMISKTSSTNMPLDSTPYSSGNAAGIATGTFIISNIYLFNYALSDEERTNIYNSGRQDRAILPDYMKWGSNTELVTDPYLNDPSKWTAETTAWVVSDGKATFTWGGSSKFLSTNIELIKNKLYRLKIVVSSGNARFGIYPNDAMNILVDYQTYTVGTHYVNFISTIDSNAIRMYASTTETFSLEEISVIKLGAVCDLEPSGIVCNSSGKVTSWTDSSDNNNDATVSGTPDLVLVKAEDYEGQGLSEYMAKITPAVNQTTATPTIVLDSKNVPEWISVKNNSANSLTFSLGTTASGTDIVNAQTIGAGKTKAFSITAFEINELGPTTLYITASGTGLNYDTNLAQKRVKL